MNLPVVLDIAIGLFFIYLIASLLASEIQELTATLLQWRAKHLRESIQNLLAGGQSTTKDDHLGSFLEAIYHDPLIRNMNQSSRGFIGTVGQWIYQNVFYRGNRIFGQDSTAPSYIAPETFATALLERVGMETLVTKLTEIRLEKFARRIVGLYEVQQDGMNQLIDIPSAIDFQAKDYREKGSIRVLAERAKSLSYNTELGETTRLILTLETSPDFQALVEEYHDILNDFRSGEADLETCVERMKEGLDIYISQISAYLSSHQAALAYQEPPDLPQTDHSTMTTSSDLTEVEMQLLNYFKKRLVTFKSSTFGEDTERAIASGKLKPTLVEIAEVFDRASMTYQEIEGAYQDIAAAYGTGKIAQDIQQFLVALNDYIQQLRQANSIPPKSALALLPNRPLTIADLAEKAYLPALNEIVPALSLRHRQIYKDWYSFQRSFTHIITAIATYLQSSGQRWRKEQVWSKPITETDLNRLHQAVRESLRKLDSDAQKEVTKHVMATLDAIDQQTYKGWQIYQTIVLEVIKNIAHLLQGEERLFDPKTRQELTQTLSELDDVDLHQAVQYSLSLLPHEERQLRINTTAKKLDSEQRKIYHNYLTYEQIQHLLGGVPAPVKQSLASLARRAQTKVQHTQNQLEQFNDEVSRWFDRSMSRASGVYKRNAKGVAIIIGFLIALLSNIDTFHIVARLSGDDDLRHIITNRASSITQNATAQELYSQTQLRQLKRDTDAILQEISLPLRWTPENLSQQFNCAAPLPPNAVIPPLTPWQTFYQNCLGQDNPPNHFDLLQVARIAIRPQNLIDSGRMLIGWFVTGLAIAMGAPFWFDLLSKIMNVRNTGAKPAPIADQETTKTRS